MSGDQPNSIVLTKSAEKRYFGDKKAFGQTLQLGSGETATDLTVTGIMKDMPLNSHLDFNMLISMTTFENEVRANGDDYVFDGWGYVDFFTYVLLKKGASEKALQAKLPAFVQRHIGDELTGGQSYRFFLEPVTDAYLSPSGGFQPGPKGNEASLYLFSVIGVIILPITCINFVNLSTAYSTRRAREVGMRKAMGAVRYQFIGQFWGETLLVVLFALGLWLVLTELLTPYFELLIGKPLSAAVGIATRSCLWSSGVWSC